MRRILLVVFLAILSAMFVVSGIAWADASVKVTREDNRPDPVDVKVGERSQENAGFTRERS